MSRVFKNKNNQITQKFKKDAKGNIMHGGIDLVGYSYALDYIVAHSDGEAVEVVSNYNRTDKTGGSYGNYVKLKHSNGYYTLYAHMKYGSVTVKKGDKVIKGQTIGYMGNTGHSMGAHLHFEVRNTNNIRIDPQPYIDADLPEIKPTNWTTGEYKLLVSKAIRTSHDLSDNIVKVGECMDSVKPNLTGTNPNEKAHYKVGTIVNITEVYIDNENRIWGKLQNCWIVLCNKDGTPQATKL